MHLDPCKSLILIIKMKMSEGGLPILF